MPAQNEPAWLITHCSGALGSALAREVLSEGHRVVVTDPRAARHALALPLPQGRAIAVDLDVTLDIHIRRAIGAALEAFGRIDVLVVNPAPFTPSRTEDGKGTRMREHLDASLVGTFMLMRAVLAVMRRQAAGHIMVTSSLVGDSRLPRDATQVMAKHALEGWLYAFAAEVAPLGICVTFVETEPLAGEFDAARAAACIKSLAGKRDAPRHVVLGHAAYDLVLEQMSAKLFEVARHRSISTATSPTTSPHAFDR